MSDVTATRGLTAPTGEGPYYISNTPRLVDGELNYTRLPGEPIAVEGHVYVGPDDSRPVPGARVEIWQADSTGAYHPPASGDVDRMSGRELALRGHVLTDGHGGYRFTTIYPGSYPGRTRHIHVRASAEGCVPVVTQIIVPPRPGDFTTPQDDQVARALPDAYRVQFAEPAEHEHEERGAIPTTAFDFHLAPRR
jgi:protocatechuate 3,4-dioxygenase beta subunit